MDFSVDKDPRQRDSPHHRASVRCWFLSHPPHMNDPSTRVRLKRNIRSLCRTLSDIKSKLCTIVMTLMSQLSGMSRSSHLSRSPSTPWGLPRSRSDGNYCVLVSEMDEQPRRGSDWTTAVHRQVPEPGDPPRATRTLHFDVLSSQDGETLSLLHRRQSRPIGTLSTSSSSPVVSTRVAKIPKEVTRSHSMKTPKKSGEFRGRYRGSSIPSEVVSYSCSGTKVKQRTISNRSLPLPGDESEYLRLRNFSVTPKGIINRGDSFRSKTSPSVKSSKEPAVTTPGCEQANTGKVPNSTPSVCKVLIVGAVDVGKTSLKSQFTTSEYICAYDGVEDDDGNRAVTIVLNSEESVMAFEEQMLYEEDVNLALRDSNPDAYVIVYSVTNRRSYSQAKLFLSEIGDGVDTKTVILVGNKTDLARLRAVTTEEGRSLAQEKGCKFIETSAAINHQVDELLVGILTQIRMKAKVSDKNRKKRETSTRISHGSKASGVLKKILRRACLKSRSCDNLHVL